MKLFKLFKRESKHICMDEPVCDHELVIIDEYIQSDCIGGHIDTWWERKLKCTLCNKEIIDRENGGWKYRARKLDYLL